MAGFTVESSVSRYPFYWFLRFDTMAVRITDWCSPGFMRQGIPRLTSSFPNDLHTKISKKNYQYLFFNITPPPPKKKKKKHKISHAVAFLSYSIFLSKGPQANPLLGPNTPLLVSRHGRPVVAPLWPHVPDLTQLLTSRLADPKDRWRRCWTAGCLVFRVTYQ